MSAVSDTSFAGRREDRSLLQGRGSFIDGLRIAELDGALYAHFVRSIEPHATLVAVDTADALAVEGVAAVFTGPDGRFAWDLAVGGCYRTVFVAPTGRTWSSSRSPWLPFDHCPLGTGTTVVEGTLSPG